MSRNGSKFRYATRIDRQLRKSTRPNWLGCPCPSSTTTNSVAEQGSALTLPVDLNLAIATIKASLGLSITDLSICLDTARQTIYTWIRKENTPHQENIARLTSLYRVAEKWQALSSLPAKGYYTKIADLLAPSFDVEEVFLVLQEALRSPKIQPRQESSFEQLLKKQGIDINKLSSQDEQFDLITGKSNFFGEFDEPEG